MKEILSKKHRIGECEIVALTEECSAVIQNKIPLKLKDPGSFTIPCMIGTKFVGKALCDLGASINLMSLSIYKKLGLKEAKPTSVTLKLADMSIAYPKGIVEDVLVKVDKFIFLVNFLVLDVEEDQEVPLILGRPFLATGRTLIDVQNGELIMRVNDEVIKFNVFEAIRFSNDINDCYLVKEVKGMDHDTKMHGQDIKFTTNDDRTKEKEVMEVNGQCWKTGVGCAIEDIPSISIEPE